MRDLIILPKRINVATIEVNTIEDEPANTSIMDTNNADNSEMLVLQPKIIAAENSQDLENQGEILEYKNHLQHYFKFLYYVGLAYFKEYSPNKISAWCVIQKVFAI